MTNSKDLESMLTKELLDELFFINPEEGSLFNKKRTGQSRAKQGVLSGYLHKKGYICVGIKARYYRRSRIIYFYVNGVWPSQIDHINGLRSDDRISNLRESDQRRNAQNRPTAHGYSFHKKEQCFHAQCSHNNKHVFIGRYKDAKSAEKAYLEFKIANCIDDLQHQKRRLDDLNKP